jgi:hypothetical protein
MQRKNVLEIYKRNLSSSPFPSELGTMIKKSGAGMK